MHRLLVAALVTLWATGSPRGQTAPRAETPEGLAAAAEALLQQGQTAEARRVLAHALEFSPNSPAINLAFGDLLLEQRRYPEAMERFETVLALDLRNLRARQGEVEAATRLALQARAMQHGEAALKCLEHASAVLPDDATLLTDLGIQALDLKLLPRAHTALTRALALSPQDLTALYALARVEIEQDHLSEAEHHLRAYLTSRPADATAHFGLGHLLQLRLRTEEARTELQRSIELQPEQTESYFELGQIALNQGENAVATGLFERTLTRSPMHGGALTGMGIAAYRARQFALARSYLARATASMPDYQPAHYYLGLTLGRLGDASGSKRELNTAIALAEAQQGRAEPTSVPCP